MAIKLYGATMSTATARVLTCMYELGIAFELVSIDLFAREHKQPSLLSKNPFGQIPALEDEDLTLFESRAMTRYLDTKYKDVEIDLLRLGDLKESTLVNVWLEVEAHQYNPAITPIVFQRLWFPMITGGTPNEEIIKSNVEKLGKVLDVYEEKLSKTKYLAGEFYSLADLHHLPYTYFLMKTPEAELINSRPHVKAWWEEISARPAFKKVVENMNKV